MNLDELVEKYKAGKAAYTPEELARREQEVWEKARGTEVARQFKIHARGRTLGLLLGESENIFHRRALLFSYGAESRPFWDRINNRQMTVSNGLTLMQEAKELAKRHGIPLSEAVTQTLASYDKLPYIRYVEGGIPSRFGKLHGRGPRKLKKQKMTRQSKKVEKAEAVLVTKIREAILEHLTSRMPGVDRVIRDKLVQETSVEIRILLRDFDSKVRRMESLYMNAAKSALAVTFDEVEAACHILSMDPPEVGQPVDMELAKKQKKRLARVYHPDAHSAEDHDLMRKKFDEVMAAFDRLEQYNAATGKPTGKESSNNGDHGSSDGDSHA